MVVLKLAPAIGALLIAAAASAHVTVSPTVAPAGTYQVLRFGGGHGCDGQATTALRIEVPAEVTIARPQPKPGWTLTIEHPNGNPAGVSAIVWRGRLPADQYDEFLIQVLAPPRGERLAFPASQSCGKATVRWDELPTPDAPRPRNPAPTVTLSAPAAATPDAGHEHHH